MVNILPPRSDPIDSPCTLAKAQEVADKVLQKVGIPLEVVKGPSGRAEQGEVPVALALRDLRHYRGVIACLKEEECLSVDDYTALCVFNQNIDKRLERKAKVIPNCTTAQKTALCAEYDAYIEPIIERCKRAQDNVSDLLNGGGEGVYRFPRAVSYSPREVAFAVLVDAAQGNMASIFLDIFRGLMEEEDAGARLCRLYAEGYDLSRLGTGSPALEAQRKVMIEYIEEQLTKHFGPEGAVHANDAQLRDSRIKLFCEGEPLSIIRTQAPPALRLRDLRAQDPQTVPAARSRAAPNCLEVSLHPFTAASWEVEASPSDDV
jgi:hypothetical protein